LESFGGAEGAEGSVDGGDSTTPPHHPASIPEPLEGPEIGIHSWLMVVVVVVVRM